MSGTKQQQQPTQDFAEDKKCRICGYADTRNINIYSPRHCKQLLSKILAVYPIVLYENDPLPKNICRKCINNVNLMYNDILRVTKIQMKWINNVRNVQPQHKYIRVLDHIENANNVTRASIKATLEEDINEVNVSRLLFANNLDDVTSPKPEKSTSSEDKPSAKPTLMSFSMDYDDGVVRKDSSSVSKNVELSTGARASTEMKDIKSILEQNGCSLLHLKSVKTTQNMSSHFSEKLGLLASLEKPKCRDKLMEDDDTNILDSILAEPFKKLPGPPPPLTVKCRLCPLQFNSLELLATHQIIHMRLCVPKIFQKKYLHKRVRRGRLISVQGRKCIRCLNCWRVFIDNKSILEHWAMGECDFYCHICGKEFAQAPKMLREHVPAAHGISYRSSKIHRARLSTKILMSMSQPPEENPDFKLYQAVSEQEPLPFEDMGARLELSKTKTIQRRVLPPVTQPSSKPTKTNSVTPPKKSSTSVFQNEDGSVSCHICLKSFQNIKARNSHMRKHKPVYAYGDVVLPPLKGVNVNVKEEFDEYTDSKEDYHNEFRSNNTSSTTQATVIASGTAFPPSSSNSSAVVPLRGVRTKFVALRTDPNGVTCNVSGNTSALKVKPLNELQNPTPTTSAAPLSPWTVNASSTSTSTNVSQTFIEIKSEPIDYGAEFTESSPHCTIAQQTSFPCIACRNEFPSKMELLNHKRRCRANFLFACEFCSQTFRCSADYYLHKTQVHKSNPN